MKIRERGTMLGRVEVLGSGGPEVVGSGGQEFWDPNKENLTAIVSCKVGQWRREK